MFGKAEDATLDEFRDLLGGGNVVTDREKMLDYTHDEYSQEDICRFPEAVVKPRTALEVSSVLGICMRKKIPLTPRGGGTGLCGGCVPVCGGVVLSLENMHRILEVDTDNLTATVEAGASLKDFYEAIEAEGLFFPPHPGDDSATVGGVIATNAGGARAVKYGVVRNFVRGLEVVTARAGIIETGGKFIKNSSGYSLLNLFIGSEGTLGVITKAVISLVAPPRAVYTLIVPYDSLDKAIGTVPAIIRGRIMPMAVEFMEKEAIRVTEKLLDKTWPAPEGSADLMIIVDGSSEEEAMGLAEAVGEICMENGALDVFVADTKQKQDNALQIRSSMYEALKNEMLEDLDVCVPRGEVARLVAAVNEIADEERMWLPSYGHAFDGNVHVHIMKSRWTGGSWEETEGWREKYPGVRSRIHETGRKLGGVISGEHGIGLVKKQYMESFLGRGQLELMKGIKGLFDPEGILNPGKVFPGDS